MFRCRYRCRYRYRYRCRYLYTRLISSSSPVCLVALALSNDLEHGLLGDLDDRDLDRLNHADQLRTLAAVVAPEAAIATESVVMAVTMPAISTTITAAVTTAVFATVATTIATAVAATVVMQGTETALFAVSDGGRSNALLAVNDGGRRRLLAVNDGRGLANRRGVGHALVDGREVQRERGRGCVHGKRHGRHDRDRRRSRLLHNSNHRNLLSLAAETVAVVVVVVTVVVASVAVAAAAVVAAPEPVAVVVVASVAPMELTSECLFLLLGGLHLSIVGLHLGGADDGDVGLIATDA